MLCDLVFFFNDTATTEIYTLSLHDALPIYVKVQDKSGREALQNFIGGNGDVLLSYEYEAITANKNGEKLEYVIPDDTIKDRKSTRLNSSHANISYAVFCLKKNNNHTHTSHT